MTVQMRLFRAVRTQTHAVYLNYCTHHTKTISRNVSEFKISMCICPKQIV